MALGTSHRPLVGIPHRLGFGLYKVGLGLNRFRAGVES